MKKITAAVLALLAFICNNEILTLFIIGIFAVSIAVVILVAWAKTEKKSLPGTFNTDWGAK